MAAISFERYGSLTAKGDLAPGDRLASAALWAAEIVRPHSFSRRAGPTGTRGPRRGPGRVFTAPKIPAAAIPGRVS